MFGFIRPLFEMALKVINLSVVFGMFQHDNQTKQKKKPSLRDRCAMWHCCMILIWCTKYVEIDGM